MTTIKYFKTMTGNNPEETIVDNDYEALCRNGKNIFESIPDDKPVKMYFDADYVFYNGDFEDYNVNVANEVLKLNKLYLSKSLLARTGVEPQFSVAESHSRRRVKNDKEVWGYSFHITIPNIVCFKKDQKKFTDELNNAIIEDQKYDSNEITNDRYTDYIHTTDDFKPFDTSVYNSGKQKFRTVYSSKSGEDRPFNIIEGTFNDTVVSGFIADNAYQYTPVFANKSTIVPQRKVENCDDLFKNIALNKEKSMDLQFVKMALDKGMLFSRSKDTEKWLATSMFLKGYFGDNTETQKLFQDFSKLCANKFNSVDNMRKWDGFVINEKYDNFGTFVNWCKEDDKVKYKEIADVIKVLKSQDKRNDKILKDNEKQQKINDKNDADMLFKTMSAEFELTHTKIINKSLFVKKVDDRVIFMTKKDLLTSYEHIQCGLNRCGNPESFIQKWTTCNNSINIKDDMENYPDVDNCPPNIFNLWTPFAMEKYTDSYETNIEALNLILNHIRILSGNDEKVYNYFVSWIAKMIQQPYKKLPCIVLISGEGAGKGTLMKLFSKMMGDKKVFETSSPSRDVWGHFNELMMDAFLVNLNELDYTETQGAEGKIKALITDTQMTINPKGTKAMKVNSYHHYIVTTNNDYSMNSKKGDRRKLISKSSDELKGNTEYFNKIYKMLEDNIVIRSCFDYFKNHDISKFDETLMPITEFQEDLQEMSVSAPEQWLMSFTIEKRGENMVEILGSEIYTRFVLWCNTNNVKYDTTPLKLGIKLKNLKIDGIEKGPPTYQGKTKIFNIDKLKKQFNIGCLIEI